MLKIYFGFPNFSYCPAIRIIMSNDDCLCVYILLYRYKVYVNNMLCFSAYMYVNYNNFISGLIIDIICIIFYLHDLNEYLL